MNLHDEIAAACGNSTALFLNDETFAHLVTDNLEIAIRLFAGKTFPVGQTGFVAKIISARNPTNAPISGRLDQRKGNVIIEVPGGLEITAEIGFDDGAGGCRNAFSDLRMNVANIVFAGKTANGELLFRPEKVDFTPSIDRRKDAEEILAAEGVTDQDAARAEGAVAHAGLQAALSRTLTAQAVDLGKLFPGIKLTGPLELIVVPSKKALVIKPTSLEQNPEHACRCADPGDAIGAPSPGSGNSGAGTIEIGGPTVPTAPNLGTRGSGIGTAGVYLPKVLFDALTSTALPAIAITVDGTSPMDWEATAVVIFKRTGLDFDPPRGAVVITQELEFRIFGEMYLDLGKLGRLKAADIKCTQKAGVRNRIKIAVYPVITPDWKLVLKAVLDDVGIGAFDVELTAAGPLGAIFGSIGAAIGFVIDVILARIISWELPKRIDGEIREQMANLSWPLLDHGNWMTLVKRTPRPGVALHHTKANSMLASATDNWRGGGPDDGTAP